MRETENEAQLRGMRNKHDILVARIEGKCTLGRSGRR
jgi:hypothetical protein